MLIGLITTPIITRIVDPVEYGQLSIFTMYTTIAVMVLCLGLDQALVRYYYEADSLDYKSSLVKKCVTIPMMITLICSLAVVLFSKLRIFNFEFDTRTMFLLCVNVSIQLVYRFSLLVVRLAYNSKLYSLLQVLQKVSYVCVAMLLINITNSKYFFMLAFATTFSFVICLTLSLISQKDIWSFRKNQMLACSVTTKDLIHYGYPFIFSMGITTLFQAIDKISLNMYCSYTEVGIYSSTMSIVHIFSLVQSTFNTLWAPTAMEHYCKDKSDRSLYISANKIITVIMFFIGISLILFKDIFALLLGEKYREAAYILPFLIFNPIMYTISETTVSGLVFTKKSNMQVVVAVGACLTNIIGNTIFVPRLGCQGAAISTGISYIVFFALRTALSNRYFYVDYPLKRFSVLTVVVCVYAYYNTFVKFSVFAVIGYFVCLAILILLYRDTVKKCLQSSLKIFSSIRKNTNKKTSENL